MTTMRALWISLLVTVLALASAVGALPDNVGGRPVISLAPLVDAASPAVVNIRVSQTVSRSNPFGDDAFRRFFGIPDVPQRPTRSSQRGLRRHRRRRARLHSDQSSRRRRR